MARLSMMIKKWFKTNYVYLITFFNWLNILKNQVRFVISDLKKLDKAQVKLEL
jgi:hypothetical protein